MKLLKKISILGTMVCSSAMAADYSAAITPEGINLYAITVNGVELVAGSPYVLPQPGEPYPLTPAIVAISPRHDFLYVVYEQLPFHGDLAQDVKVVGLKITAQGLINQWSSGMNVDPAEYKFISLSVGLENVIVFTRPAGVFAAIFNEAGQQLFGDGSHGGDQLISGRVAPGSRFYYACRNNSAATMYVNVYRLGTAESPSPSLLLTSYDPGFMQSVCN
jgi:hypothetical protein